MSTSAGFAIIAQIDQATLQNFIRIYCNAGVLPTHFSGNTTLLFSPEINVQYDLHMLEPIVELRGDTPNLVTISTILIGSTTTTIGGFPSDQVVAAHLTFTATPLAQLTPTGDLRIGLDPSTLEIEALNVHVLSGVLPAPLADLLQSPFGRIIIASHLSAEIGDFENSSFPLNPATLNELEGVTFTRIVTRVLDGCFAIAADVLGFYDDTESGATVKVNTQGDEEAILPLLNKVNTVLFVNSAILPILWIPALDIQNAELQQTRNVQIHNFKLFLENGNFLMKGQGWEGPHGDHAANFSARVRVLLGTPDKFIINEDEDGHQWKIRIPGSNTLMMEVYDVNVDPIFGGSLAEVLAFIGVMTVAFPASPLIFGVIKYVVDKLTSSIASEMTSKIGQGAGEKLNEYTPLSEKITLPETKYSFVTKSLKQLGIVPEGLLVRHNFNEPSPWDQPPTGNVDGPLSCDIDRSLDPIEYNFKWVYSAGWATSQYNSIRWMVHRLDTGQVIRAWDGYMYVPNATRFTLTLSPDEINECSNYKVSCRVYTLKNIDIFNQTLPLVIKDKLDKSFPFVSWTHTTFVPIIFTNTKKQRLHLGYKPTFRQSDIHRTDYPSRCRSASHRGYDSKLTYYEKLPFPLEQIEERRRKLCDYCFYGGPDKKSLRADVLTILNS